MKRGTARGFTLIELMVVVAIIGLLSGLVAVNVMGRYDQARLATARSDVLRLQDVVIAYQMELREMPVGIAALIEPDGKGRVWLTGYARQPEDPWGRPYVLRVGEGDPAFEVICSGPDGEEGTEDDISSRTARNR